jgi:hypothetical protein
MGPQRSSSDAFLQLSYFRRLNAVKCIAFNACVNWFKQTFSHKARMGVAKYHSIYDQKHSLIYMTYRATHPSKDFEFIFHSTALTSLILKNHFFLDIFRCLAI